MSTKPQQVKEAEALTGDMELPEGWVSIRLEEHVYIAGRIGWRGLKAEEYTAAGPILLSVPNLNYGDTVDFREVNHISRARYEESPEIQLKPGDILLVKDGAGIGKLGYVDSLPADATVNSSLLLVRPQNGLLYAKYLFYYFRGPEFQSIALNRITGSATPHLFQKDIKLFQILVPPLTEQYRIVNKSDGLLVQLNAAKTRLAKLPTFLRYFRKAVLAAACSGKLTEEWRKANPDVEPSGRVIQKISAKRKSAGLEIVEGPIGLPESWTWVAFGSLIGELRNGISIKPEIDPPGKPILRISAVRSGKVILDDFRYLSAAGDFSEYRLQNRDLLFTRYNGSLELLGVCGMVRGLEEKPMLYPDKLMRVRFDNPWVLPSYAEVFFGSPQARDRMTEKAKS